MTPQRMFAVLMLTFGSVLVLNRTSGFRSAKGVTLREEAMDTVDAMAIGVVRMSVIAVCSGDQMADASSVRALGESMAEVRKFNYGN